MWPWALQFVGHSLFSVVSLAVQDLIVPDEEDHLNADEHLGWEAKGQFIEQEFKQVIWVF